MVVRHHVPRLVIQILGLPSFVLYKVHQGGGPCLQQRMPTHHRQELLQALAPALDVQVVELIQVEQDLARKLWNDHSRRLLLQHFAETDEVAVTAANSQLPLLKRRYVGAAYDLVVGVCFSADVGLWVFDLMLVRLIHLGYTYLDLEEILRLAVDVRERLLFVFAREDFTYGLKWLGHGEVEWLKI